MPVPAKDAGFQRPWLRTAATAHISHSTFEQAGLWMSPAPSGLGSINGSSVLSAIV